jgi:hypothetical protein
MHASPAQSQLSWRYWSSRLVVMVGAIAIGLALQEALGTWLASIQALAERDVIAARAELAFLLRVVGGGVFAMTGIVGVAMSVASRRAFLAGVFPPPGVWSLGSRNRIVGPRAQMLARVWLGLAAVVTVLSLAGLGLVLYMAEVLLACKAA